MEELKNVKSILKEFCERKGGRFKEDAIGGMTCLIEDGEKGELELEVTLYPTRYPTGEKYYNVFVRRNVTGQPFNSIRIGRLETVDIAILSGGDIAVPSGGNALRIFGKSKDRGYEIFIKVPDKKVGEISVDVTNIE